MGINQKEESVKRKTAKQRMRRREKQKAQQRARQRAKHFVFILKGCLLFAIIISVLTLINTVLIPKYYYNNTWPTTTTIEQFYQMDKDSVDVLILGSSHAVTGICPQELYNNYGIRSYNLGTEQQNLLVSYYLIKEALKYQSPKAIVLDVYMCYTYNNEEPLNSAEGFTRKVIDSMRWSKVKTEAVDSIVKADKKQTKSSYYFVNQRFHTRWTGLNEEDFTYVEMESYEGLKGYSLLNEYVGAIDYSPFEAETWDEDGESAEGGERSDNDENEDENSDNNSQNQGNGESDDMEIREDVDNGEMVPLMEEYLEKIVQLCKEKDIDLILVKTPYTAANVQRYRKVTEYAAENQIQYYDFNEKTLYEKIGYEFEVDNQDGGHANYWGSKKITAEIGTILKDVYHIAAIKDEQWEDTDEIYQNCIDNAELTHITDIKEYLEAIRKPDYAIFIAVSDEGSESLDKDILNGLYRLGLEGKVYGKLRYSYYAVITKDEIIEEAANEKLSVTGLFRDGHSKYSVVSAGNQVGNLCSIKIDNKEYAKNKRGLNIVVYDYNMKKVIDSVCFDTFIPELSAIR